MGEPEFGPQQAGFMVCALMGSAAHRRTGVTPIRTLEPRGGCGAKVRLHGSSH